MNKKLFIPLIILVLLLIAAAVTLIIWAPWKGAGEHVTVIVLDESQPIELALADGTAIIAPPGSLPEGAAISIKKIDPKDAPLLLEGFAGVASLYDFSADHPIKESVTIRIPIPDAELVVLGHYHNWNWEAVPFNEENGKAVVEVNNLSFFGWLDVSDFTDKVLDFFTLRWMDKEPTLTYDSNIVVDESKTYDLISGSVQLIEDNTVKITIYNNAPVHLEVYPVDYPAKSFELKKTGIYTYEEYTILAPNSYGRWTTDLVIDETVTFNACFSDLALAAFVGDLIPYGRLARGITEGALFARNGREMKWADVKSLLIFPIFAEAAKTVKGMKDMPDALLETASIVFTRVESDEPSASEKELIKESDKNAEEIVEEVTNEPEEEVVAEEEEEMVEEKEEPSPENTTPKPLIWLFPDRPNGEPIACNIPASEGTFVFKDIIMDNEGDNVKLQMELKPLNESFTGTPNYESDWVKGYSNSPLEIPLEVPPSKCLWNPDYQEYVASISVYLTEGSYHWQHRAIDKHGATSPWEKPKQELQQLPTKDTGVPITIIIVKKEAEGN